MNAAYDFGARTFLGSIKSIIRRRHSQELGYRFGCSVEDRARGYCLS